MQYLTWYTDSKREISTGSVQRRFASQTPVRKLRDNDIKIGMIHEVTQFLPIIKAGQTDT